MNKLTGKVTPWRRKPKITDLQGDLTTGLCFAVVADADKFSNKLHAYKVYKLLKDLGAEVYPVSPDLDKVEKTKVVPSLLSLPVPVDVVIPCLPDIFALSIVQEAQEVGINKVWFQEKTFSQEAEQFCMDHGIEI